MRVTDRSLAALIALVSGALYSLFSWQRFAHFLSPSWDNAIYEQEVQQYAHLHLPIVTVKGPDYLIWGDHWTPIVATLAPIYRLFPYAQTLLIAQVVLISLSAYVIGALAMRRLGRWWGLCLAIAYALSFGVQAAVKAEFHEVAFAPVFLALAGAAYLDKRWSHVVWWSLPLLFIKEDLGLTVAAIGFVLWLAGERKRGAILAVVGCLTLAVLVLVILPTFSSTGGYEYTSRITQGGGPLQALGTKSWAALLTFAVTGFAALFSPWALLVLPTFAWRFTGNVEFYWGTDWHYSLVLMPIVFVAAIDAIERRPQLRWAAPIALLVALVSLPGSNLGTLVDPVTYQSSPQLRAAQQAVDSIPDSYSVETSTARLVTHLATGHRVVWWTGTMEAARPDAIFLRYEPKYGLTWDPEAYGESYYGGQWQTTFNRYGYRVATHVPGSGWSENVPNTQPRPTDVPTS